MQQLRAQGWRCALTASRLLHMSPRAKDQATRCHKEDRAQVWQLQRPVPVQRLKIEFSGVAALKRRK